MAEPSQDPVSPLRQLLMQFIGGGGGGMAASRQGPAPAPAQQAAPASPSVPVVTSGANQVPAERPSLLESLRENVNDMVRPPPSTADRLAALGAGVLTNPRSRSGFFGDLAAGIQAQQQFEGRAREERLKGIEAQARIAEQERRAQMEKAKFAEETTPGTLSARLKEAEIASRTAQAGAANRPQYQVVGTDAQGNAVVVDMRDPTRTQVLQGVRPTRSEIAQSTAERARIERADRAGQTAVQNAVRNGQVRENDQAGQNRIYQDAYQRTLRSMEESASAPGARGPQQPQAPSEGGPTRLDFNTGRPQ